MKIAIVSPGFLPVPSLKGGAVELLITEIIIKNEEAKYFEIDLYTIDFDYNILFSRTTLIKIKTSKLSFFIEKFINKTFSVLNISKMFRIYDRKVAKQIRKTKYEYILIENNMYLYNQIIKKYPFDTKYIFHLHNDILGNDKPKHLCELISNTAYKVITVSEYIKSRFVNATNRKENVKVLLNSIDLSQFNPKNYKSKKAHNNIRTFLYVGRFSEEKGLLELVKAFNNFSYKKNNLNLIVAGNYKENSKYSKEVMEISRRNNNIKMLGYISNNNMPEIYSKCDVVVVPSICEEAFGLTALEALSMEKPVIVTNSGGLPEIVKQNFGILIEKENIINDLENAIEMMCKDEVYKTYSTNIKNNKEYLFQFSLNTYLKRFIDIIIGDNAA